jgi:hypothetical protein
VKDSTVFADVDAKGHTGIGGLLSLTVNAVLVERDLELGLEIMLYRWVLFKFDICKRVVFQKSKRDKLLGLREVAWLNLFSWLLTEF